MIINININIEPFSKYQSITTKNIDVCKLFIFKFQITF